MATVRQERAEVTQAPRAHIHGTSSEANHYDTGFVAVLDHIV